MEFAFAAPAPAAAPPAGDREGEAARSAALGDVERAGEVARLLSGLVDLPLAPAAVAAAIGDCAEFAEFGVLLLLSTSDFDEEPGEFDGEEEEDAAGVTFAATAALCAAGFLQC